MTARGPDGRFVRAPPPRRRRERDAPAWAVWTAIGAIVLAGLWAAALNYWPR
jgi:hypothetical protein